MSSAIFPVEIMNEIFRSSELDSRTLASCCLLSHKYLQGARRWLYNAVVVCITGHSVKGTGGPIYVNEYSRSSFRLLAVIQAEPNLRNLVRFVHFGTPGSYKPSGIQTDKADAIATFCSILTKLHSISLDSIFNDFVFTKTLNQLTPTRFERLRELKIRKLTKHSSNFLSQLHQLERLYIQEIANDLGPFCLPISKLKVFCLEDAPEGFSVTNLISASRSTLEDLQMAFNALFSLTLIDFPRLKRIELLLNCDELTGDAAVRNGDIWRPAAGCQELVTLAFNWGELTRTVDSYIFGRNGGLSSYMPASVRRIEFIGGISVDRLLCFFYNVNIDEIAVNPDDLEPYELEILEFICERGSVELIFLASS
jgi:hypothetical protein